MTLILIKTLLVPTTSTTWSSLAVAVAIRIQAQLKLVVAVEPVAINMPQAKLSQLVEIT